MPVGPDGAAATGASPTDVSLPPAGRGARPTASPALVWRSVAAPSSRSP